MKLNPLLVCALSALLVACGSSKEAKKILNDLDQRTSYKNMKGLWQADGYPQAIDITDRWHKTYQFSRGHCLLAAEEPIDQVSRVRPQVITNIVRDRFRTDPELLADDIHPYYFDRLKRLPSICRDRLLEPTDDPVVNFNVLWHSFNDYYAFFGLREVAWNQVRQDYLPEVERIRNTGEGSLFDIFEDIIPLFNDGHVGVYDPDTLRTIFADQLSPPQLRVLEEFRQRFSNAQLERDYQRDPEGAASFADYIELRQARFYTGIERNFWQNIESYLRAPLKKRANDQLQWGILARENVGYLNLVTMADYVDDDNATDREHRQALNNALDEFMADTASTDALIIDTRLNQGGSDAASLEIAKRFFQKKTFILRKRARSQDNFGPWSKIYVEPNVKSRYNKPIFLLTSGLTASAAEIFTLAMKTLPNVTIIGEPSAGALSDVLGLQLPNGWFMGLSNEVYEAADGRVYEGVGVPVAHQALLFDEAYRINQQDAGIESVLDTLP